MKGRRITARIHGAHKNTLANCGLCQVHCLAAACRPYSIEHSRDPRGFKQSRILTEDEGDGGSGGTHAVQLCPANGRGRLARVRDAQARAASGMTAFAAAPERVRSREIEAEEPPQRKLAPNFVRQVRNNETMRCLGVPAAVGSVVRADVCS